MPKHIINSEQSLQSFIGDMREQFAKHKYIIVNTKVGKDRSLDQNAISHCWYEQLARENKEYDALGWKAFCKLHYGIPILKYGDVEFKAFYDASLNLLTYEQKLEAMKFVPVTSLMTKEMLSKYLEAMKSHFNDVGIRLEFPENNYK